MVANSQPFPRAWLVVALLWFVVFSNFLARLLPTTMHGSLVAAFPMTEAQFGLLTSSLLWTYGLTSPFAGFLADRFSRSRVILTSMFLWSVITWLTSYARSYEQLLILRILMGLTEALYLPTALALISDYHKGPTQALATGIHQTGYVIGIGLSGVGGWLAERTNWHYPFTLVGLVSLGYCAFLALLLRDAPRESSSRVAAAEAEPKVRFGEILVSLFSRGSFVLMFIGCSLTGVIAWTVFGWMPVFLQEHFHLTQGVAGFSASGYLNAAAVFGLIVGGGIADKLSRTYVRGRVVILVLGLLGASLGILLAANTDVFSLAMLGLLVFGFFFAFDNANIMPTLCQIVDRRYRATAYGMMNLTGGVTAGLGIYFSGMLRDSKIDLHFAFDVVAAIAVICAVMFSFVKTNPARVMTDAVVLT